ncbi:MAG: hypothetical protein K9H58_17580 [Bacteroidales bacterium]|nr:hypothetical protein [Bacteroidales bacterium]
MIKICRDIVILQILLGSSSVLLCQNVLVLEKATKREIYYEPGDWIKIHEVIEGRTLSGQIFDLSDSSLVVGGIEVLIKDIDAVYRILDGYKLLQRISLLAGASYITLNAVNGFINSDDPMVPNETLIIGTALIGAGFALQPLTTRRHKVKNGIWRLKILDYTEEKPL